MKILIAPDSFKGSCNAWQAADAIEQGLRSALRDAEIVKCPVADGGEGTAQIIATATEAQLIKAEVRDPLGRMIEAKFAWIDSSSTAIIELAEASGMHLLQRDELDPIFASTYGTGELISKALDYGAKKIIIGMGGSATVDCGAGILEALGVVFKGRTRRIARVSGGNLGLISEIDTSNLDPRLKECDILVAADVMNPLLGAMGAVPIFAPQKGASPEDLEILEQNVAHFASVTLTSTGKNIRSLAFGGAAGGAAAGLYAFLDARLSNGIDLMLSLTDFAERLKDVDLVITGEGTADIQTQYGKAPFGVGKMAKKSGIPVYAIVGGYELIDYEFVDVLLSICHKPCTLDYAMDNTYSLIVNAAKQLGKMISINNKIFKANLEGRG